MAVVPRLAGVHHVKLPVTDLKRSAEWYSSRLGYRVDVEYVEKGELIGLAMRHPNGGPTFALQLDPDRARGAAGFDYFAIGVPDNAAIDAVAAHLESLGESHGGVRFGTIGWNLLKIYDPDGHQLRFYTNEHHTELSEDSLTTVNDHEETFKRNERAYEAAKGSANG